MNRSQSERGAVCERDAERQCVTVRETDREGGEQGETTSETEE